LTDDQSRLVFSHSGSWVVPLYKGNRYLYSFLRPSYDRGTRTVREHISVLSRRIAATMLVLVEMLELVTLVIIGGILVTIVGIHAIVYISVGILAVEQGAVLGSVVALGGGITLGYLCILFLEDILVEGIADCGFVSRLTDQ
jgi:hypothetical protein